MAKLRLGVLVSGRGTNLQAILDAAVGDFPAEVAVVISNHPGVTALERAAASGVPALVIARGDYPTRRAHQFGLAAALAEHDVELVVLAGYDRVLLPAFIRLYEGRIINVHPSLLPAFGGGLHAQAAAVSYGVKVSGCTVHFVTNEVDGGPIIIQRAVPVFEYDTAESLGARILIEEHVALPWAIRLFAEGKLSIEGRIVHRCGRSVADNHRPPSSPRLAT